MRILLPATPQDGDFIEALNQVESWDLAIVPYNLPGRDKCFKQDLWLGSSRNGRTWLLAAAPYDTYEGFDPAETTVAALLDPPKQNKDTIAEILLRIYIAGRNVEQLSNDAIDEILVATPFPEYRPVAIYLPKAPQDWLHLPAEFVVSFSLSEGACVTGGLFEEYRRDSLEEVLRIVCGPRQDGILIAYSLAAREVVPLLTWDIDWPLARRGKGAPVRRDKVQSTLPWDSETDQSLFSIYQHVPGTGFWIAPPYYSKPTVRLRVGGRSQEEAVSNWYQCARALRTMKQNIPVSDPLWERGETDHE